MAISETRLDEGLDPHTWRGNVEGKKGPAQDIPGHVRQSIISNWLSWAQPAPCRHSLGCSRWGAHWRHLVNATEPCVCNSDAAYVKITLTTCLLLELVLCPSVLWHFWSGNQNPLPSDRYHHRKTTNKQKQNCSTFGKWIPKKSQLQMGLSCIRQHSFWQASQFSRGATVALCSVETDVIDYYYYYTTTSI